MDDFSEYYVLVRKTSTSKKQIKSIVSAAVAELQKPNSEDAYLVMACLGYCYPEAKQYLPLVESYLDGPDDSTAKEALWVLCSCWDLSPQYTDRILAFMEGVPLDTFGDVRVTAITCAAIHLKHYSAPVLLRKLIEIAEDKNDRERLYAYHQLVKVTGGDIYKRPLEPYNVDVDAYIKAYIDTSVMRLAKERLAREEREDLSSNQ